MGESDSPARITKARWSRTRSSETAAASERLELSPVGLTGLVLALELRRNETRRLGLRSGAGTRTRRGGTAPRAPSACQRTGSLRTSSRVRESNPLRRHQKPLANRWPYPECIVRRSGVEPDPYRLRACRTASVLTTRGTPEGRTQSVSGKSRTRSRAPTSRIAFSALAQVDLLPLPWSAVESNHPP